MTIEAVKPTGTWEGPSGLLYVIQVTLSDGTSGEVMATSPDRWSVGDEVEVSNRKETQYGVKLKLQKPGFGKPGQGGSYGGGRDKRGPQIESQWAINAAIEYLKLRGIQVKNTAQIQSTAEDMLAVRDNLMSREQ